MKYSWLIIVIIAILVIGVAIVFLLMNNSREDSIGNSVNRQANNQSPANQAPVLTAADQAGKDLSGQKCEGTEKAPLTHLPMNLEDFSMIIPYGLTAGAHVTPIDHQYFEPADRSLGIDAYPVYAMADSRIVDIGMRPRTSQTGIAFSDYRIIFSISCRLLYYYDLVTSLAPDVAEAFERDSNRIDLEVQAGQLIGYIGEQTLDFAVWDTEKPLQGYIVPEHYEREGWKIYTADPLDYYTDEIREQALSKYIRVAEPRSGKIDYDIDGKLIGNWFQQNADGSTDGYAGGGKQNYWLSHLSFSPDHLDPSGVIVSIGNWPDENMKQFSVLKNTPDPAMVGVDSGLVKYELTQVNYKAGSGYWDRMSFATPITFEAGSYSQGCMLVQLVDERTLRAEGFQNKSCATVAGFTDAALTYIR